MIEPLSGEELAKDWPKSEDGMRCLNLLQRFLYTLGVETAAGADCLSRAQAEAAANKTIAQISRVVNAIPKVKIETKPGRMMKPLHRHRAGETEQPQTENKQ